MQIKNANINVQFKKLFEITKTTCLIAITAHPSTKDPDHRTKQTNTAIYRNHFRNEMHTRIADKNFKKSKSENYK